MANRILPKYIYEILEQICKDNGFRDYTIHEKSGSQTGDGFSSKIISINISENNSEKQQLDIVCKVAPFDKKQREQLHSDNIFNREATFYNKVMPTFEAFQIEKNLSKEDQFQAYPKCYAAIADNENEQYAIILEDLRSKGFRMWNKARVLPIESVQLAMRELGKFHGISIAMKDQKPDEFMEFQKITDICRKFVKEMEVFAGMFDASFDRAIKFLNREDHKSIMRHIKEYKFEYFDYLLSGNSRFSVISHGIFFNK